MKHVDSVRAERTQFQCIMLSYIEDSSYLGCYAVFVCISRRLENSYCLRLQAKSVQEEVYPYEEESAMNHQASSGPALAMT